MKSIALTFNCNDGGHFIVVCKENEVNEAIRAHSFPHVVSYKLEICEMWGEEEVIDAAIDKELVRVD